MDKAGINISTNSIVSIIIAIVIIGMVLIPIVNSLGDGNGSGGNGSGGNEDEPQKTVINSWEDSFGAGFTSTKYKSYEFYSSSETPTLPHEIIYTLDDFRAMVETFDPSLQVSLFATHDEEFSNGINISCAQNNLKIDLPNISLDNSTIKSFNISVSTDYTVTYSATYKEGDLDKTTSDSFTAVEMMSVSESEYGWILFVDITLHPPYITNGSGLYLDTETPDAHWSKFVVLTQDMFSDNQLQFTVDWEEGYHSDVTIPIQSTATEGVWQIAWNGDNYETIPVKDSNGIEVEDSEVYFEGWTTYGYVSSDNTTIVNVGEHYYTPRENSRIDYLFRVVDDMCEIRSSPDLGSVEPVVVAQIPYVEGDETPYLCIAFGEGGSLWWSKGGYICMARSSEYGTTTIPSVSIDYASISATGEYDSHTYGNMTGLDYYLAVDGTYVYSETNPKASLTDTIYISAPTLNANDRAVSVHSFGTPQNALDNIAGNYDTTVTNVDAHYTVGDYVSIDSVDVAYTIDDTPGEMTVKGFFVPKEFTYTPSDSGSDSGSGSGSNGMTSTIISIIPVFAVLGLLIFILNKLGIIDALTKSK